jgi:hypothetical protein
MHVLAMRTPVNAPTYPAVFFDIVDMALRPPLLCC